MLRLTQESLLKFDGLSIILATLSIPVWSAKVDSSQIQRKEIRLQDDAVKHTQCKIRTRHQIGTAANLYRERTE